MRKQTSNPTLQTQSKILKEIEKQDTPQSITSIADNTGVSIYAVKTTIEFLSELGVLKVMTSTGGMTFVFPLNKEMKSNAGS